MHSCSCIIFKLTFIVIIVYQYVCSSQDLMIASSDDNDDANILKQALFLVKLLKSDPVVLLRNNNNLDNNAHEEDSTCPANFSNTTETMDVNKTMSELTPKLSSLISKVPTNRTETSLSRLIPTYAVASTSSYILSSAVSSGNLVAENYKYPNRFQRRRMYSDYYYYGTKSHSNQNNNIRKVGLSHQRSNTKKSNEDVVLSQVASELIKEIRATKTKNMPAKIRRRFNNIIFKKNKKATVLQKSTMKIYLKSSSKIQIPLPENNLFCHLYPQSRLCGTAI